MEFTFENQGTNTYLVYTVAPDDDVDTMSLGMLTNNKISGLASTLFTQIDATKYIKYNVSAKISVKQFFSGPVNKKRLLGVFSGIVDAMLSAEDYMIDANTILLDLNYIFADVSTCETVLICLPILNKALGQMDLGIFFKNIMFSTQFDQTENCDHVAKIINYLNCTPVFSLEDFKRLLEELTKTETVVPTVQQPIQKQVVVQQPVPQPMVSQPIVMQQNVVESTKKASPVPTAMPNQLPPMSQIEQTRKAAPAAAPKIQESSDKEEKKMSMFYLLQHYNKENAAIYKAQKETKKDAKNVQPTSAPASNKKDKKKNKKEKRGKALEPQTFNVPSAANNSGFAIPGQPAPSPAAMPQPTAPKNVQPTVQQVPVQLIPTQQPVQPAVQSNAIPETPVQPRVNPVPVQQSAFTPRPVPQGQTMNFGETTVLGGVAIGETTVLMVGQAQAQRVAPHLLRTKNNEKISLNKPVFRIGKERSYVDYFIGDNTAISRSHANFITRDGEYFVVDTNSTNHTYVNGNMIASNEETAITHGDTIRLANEDFEFRLY